VNPPTFISLTRSLAACAVIAAAAGCGISKPYVRPELAARAAGAVPPESVHTSLFLIGDAGRPSNEYREPTYIALEQLASVHPERNLVVFLGDNIYPSGLAQRGDQEREQAEWILNEQISILTNSGARGIFLPGNHDWGYYGDEGLATVKRQQEYIQNLAIPSIMFQPGDGHPGPVINDVGDHLRLIVLDTEWWLHGQREPRAGDDGCPLVPEEDSILTALSEALEAPAERVVAVVAHHPPETYGNHGGFFTWKDHLFPLTHLEDWLWLPLPILGSVYPLSRNLGISHQDLSGGPYRRMVQRLDSVLARHPPLLFAAGHEHTLQVLQGKRPYAVLVSGRGAADHDNPLTTAPSMVFGDVHPGFMRVDLLVDGRVRLGVLRAAEREGAPEEVFSCWLRRGSPARPEQ